MPDLLSKTKRMRRTKLFSVARTIRTYAHKSIATIAPTCDIPLDAYYETSFQTKVYSWNRAIDDNIKSGSLDSALKLFDEMPVRDVISWNLIISGYGRFGLPVQALYLFGDMIRCGIKESAPTVSTVLSICSVNEFYLEGRQVHCRVIILGFDSSIFVVTPLVGLYMEMGLVDVAEKLFYGLPYRNLATWNLMLRGYCNVGQSDDILSLYLDMRSEGVEPNGLSFCYLMNQCGKDKLIVEGQQLHCCILKLGWLASNLFIANALVDFYSACGCLYGAIKSLEAICIENVISWNSLVSVYAENWLSLDALETFNRMQLWGKKPSFRSFLAFLGLSSGTQNLVFGRQIHVCVIKMGFDIGSLHIRSALIDMYGKCGEIESSVKLFKDINKRNVECCNSLMTSLMHCGFVEDVLELFGLMLDEGINFDEVSLSTTLKALSISTSKFSASCPLVHCCMIKSGFKTHVVVSCSLIDAYSKCGLIAFSQKVFDELPSPNMVCFTSIINSYARNGMGKESLRMFQKMILMGIKPDRVTFLSLLTGCNHSGLVKEGKMVFESIKSYGMEPYQEHYLCLVDLLGRAGLVEEAEEILNLDMMKSNSKMWSSLVQSCRVHKNEMVGKRAAEVLMGLEPDDHTAYFEVSRFYSEIGDFGNSARVRELAMARKTRKEIAYSWIDVNEPVFK